MVTAAKKGAGQKKKPKSKAIFIDNGSLNGMGRPLGIRNFNFRAIYEILTKEIGQCTEVYGKPLVVHVASGTPQENKWLKVLEAIGYEVIKTEPGKDDQAIIDAIARLDPKEVGEIVLVSADQDYVPVLEAKRAKGAKIYWVATRELNGKGEPLLGCHLETLFDDIFQFIELGDFKERITHKPWIDRLLPAPAPATTPASESVELILRIPGGKARAFEAAMKIVSQFPEIKFEMKG